MLHIYFKKCHYILKTGIQKFDIFMRNLYLNRFKQWNKFNIIMKDSIWIIWFQKIFEFHHLELIVYLDSKSYIYIFYSVYILLSTHFKHCQPWNFVISDYNFGKLYLELRFLINVFTVRIQFCNFVSDYNYRMKFYRFIDQM